MSVLSCWTCEGPIVLDPDLMRRAEGRWTLDCPSCGAPRAVRESDKWMPITPEIVAARLTRLASEASARKGLRLLRARRSQRNTSVA